MLDGSKSDTQGVSDDMPADDQADVSTEPDMPGEVDMPSGIDTRTHDQAMASAEVDMSVSIKDDTSTITDAPVIDTDAGVRSDMPKLDDMLKGLMKFETKLFGEEDEAKLRAFISQLKADEAGHVEEVKDSIQHLEAYRSTLTDATLPIPKAAADRMILLAEVFTSMIASAPVDVVVESIQAMKASGEKPSIEELEEASRRMLDMLDGSKSDTQGVSDDMPADDQADVSTKPDMPGEVDMPSGIDTRTHDQAMASAEIDMSVENILDFGISEDASSTTTEAPSTIEDSTLLTSE